MWRVSAILARATRHGPRDPHLRADRNWLSTGSGCLIVLCRLNEREAHQHPCFAVSGNTGQELLAVSSAEVEIERPDSSGGQLIREVSRSLRDIFAEKIPRITKRLLKLGHFQILRAQMRKKKI